MQDFHKYGNILIWEANHERTYIESWERNSLRERATISLGIYDDLFSALIDQLLHKS